MSKIKARPTLREPDHFEKFFKNITGVYTHLLPTREWCRSKTKAMPEKRDPFHVGNSLKNYTRLYLVLE